MIDMMAAFHDDIESYAVTKKAVSVVKGRLIEGQSTTEVKNFAVYPASRRTLKLLDGGGMFEKAIEGYSENPQVNIDDVILFEDEKYTVIQLDTQKRGNYNRFYAVIEKDFDND